MNIVIYDPKYGKPTLQFSAAYSGLEAASLIKNAPPGCKVVFEDFQPDVAINGLYGLQLDSMTWFFKHDGEWEVIDSWIVPDSVYDSILFLLPEDEQGDFIRVSEREDALP